MLLFESTEQGTEYENVPFIALFFSGVFTSYTVPYHADSISMANCRKCSVHEQKGYYSAFILARRLVKWMKNIELYSKTLSIVLLKLLLLCAQIDFERSNCASVLKKFRI